MISQAFSLRLARNEHPGRCLTNTRDGAPGSGVSGFQPEVSPGIVHLLTVPQIKNHYTGTAAHGFFSPPHKAMT